jgi:subtilase family serine protease
MIRTVTAILFVVALAPVGAAAATCAGSNPAITSAVVRSVTTAGMVNRYHVAGTVTNLGIAEAGNVLQFVDIYVDGQKQDSRGIPPLANGQSYTFTYVWLRAADAGKNTTTLNFRIDMTQGNDCNPANGTYNLTF